ncbi:MAG TPA: phosphatidate cytidylyltransferase [Stellaceae bacterium]|nr:phosphatidate cytidylyltransferase [Stellaceae bacterium]
MGAARPDTLLLRIASAAVLGPVAVGAAWLGGWYFGAVVLAAAIAMGWEWGRLTSGGEFGRDGALVLLTIFVAATSAAAGAPRLGLGLLAVGVLAVFTLTSSRRGGAAVCAAAGASWIGASCIALLWIAADPALGRQTVLWIFALVWATDSAAFLVGRFLGGPRLAPVWSPKKTWSGALGGLAAGGVVGVVTAKLMGMPEISTTLWLSLGLSVLEQMGDLAESAAKRRFGVKDMSGLIPGHGGILDRVDGMLAVVTVVAFLALIRGASPLAWG